MTWDIWPSSKQAYLHSFNRNGISTRVYFGTGPTAELAERWFLANRITTMDMAHKLKREIARRHFESAKDVDAEIDKYIDNIRTTALNELIGNLITTDPWKQEAYFQLTVRAAAELAGPNPSGLIRLWSRLVAESHLEAGAIDVLLFKRLGKTGFLDLDDLNKQRYAVGRRLASQSKTLAFIRRIEMSEIETTLSKFKIAG